MAAAAELNDDVLVEIAKRIGSYRDFVAFRCVCTAWRSAAVIQNFGSRFNHNRTPWLMLAEKKKTDKRDFFDVANEVTRTIGLPEARHRKCYSSKGWLITIASDSDCDVDGSMTRMSLLHPFSRAQINLPNLSKFQDFKRHYNSPLRSHFIWKGVLSSNPSYTSDYTVMVIFGTFSKLGYCKPGDEEWTTIESFGGAVSDVIYQNQQFYAITYTRTLLVFGGHDLTVAKDTIEMPEEIYWMRYRRNIYDKRYYLVESESEETLWVVVRIEDNDGFTCETKGFQVFEVNLNTKTWTKVQNLGNKALFLGHNSSLSIEASAAKPNSIYFTDDYCTVYQFNQHRCRGGGGKEMGIYDMKAGKILPYPIADSYHHLTPPMWVEQSYL